MKKFQPMTPAEHLQALYLSGEDWALEALEMVEAVDTAYADTQALSELRGLLYLDSGFAAEEVASIVEGVLVAAGRLVDDAVPRDDEVGVCPILFQSLVDAMPKPRT
jgi:hypothetical protein